MLIFSINPPILADAIFSLSNRTGPVVKGVTQSTSAIYSIDIILTTLAITKTWFLIKLLPLVTSVTADNSRKINEIKGLIPDFYFYLRVSLLERPTAVLTVSIFYIAIFFGISIDYFERSQTLVNPKTGLSS
jgi:hypothetical protein